MSSIAGNATVTVQVRPPYGTGDFTFYPNPVCVYGAETIDIVLTNPVGDGVTFSEFSANDKYHQLTAKVEARKITVVDKYTDAEDSIGYSVAVEVGGHVYWSDPQILNKPRKGGGCTS